MMCSIGLSIVNKCITLMENSENGKAIYVWNMQGIHGISLYLLNFSMP